MATYSVSKIGSKIKRNMSFFRDVKLDAVDMFLSLAGFYVPYYWLLKYVRREYLNGGMTEDEANNILVQYCENRLK